MFPISSINSAAKSAIGSGSGMIPIPSLTLASSAGPAVSGPGDTTFGGTFTQNNGGLNVWSLGVIAVIAVAAIVIMKGRK